MQTGVKQVFYFNASANSLGGFVENPFRFIPTPTSASLSPTGGSIVSRAAGFAFEKVLSCKVAYSFVTGRPLQVNGPWTHRTVSVVEGFSLLGGRITADRLTAQTFVTQPAAGKGPRQISFAGSHIDNLRVDGKPLNITYNPALLPQQTRTVDAYDQAATVEPNLQGTVLGSLAYRQAAGVLQNKTNPQWVHDRYSWIAATKTPEQPNPAGYTLCSLVDKIDGAPAPTYGHCFELPDVGRIFLGEIMIHPQSTSLTMIRAELGCAFTGHASAASVVSNGSSCPPSLDL